MDNLQLNGFLGYDKENKELLLIELSFNSQLYVGVETSEIVDYFEDEDERLWKLREEYLDEYPLESLFDSADSFYDKKRKIEQLEYDVNHEKGFFDFVDCSFSGYVVLDINSKNYALRSCSFFGLDFFLEKYNNINYFSNQLKDLFELIVNKFNSKEINNKNNYGEFLNFIKNNYENNEFINIYNNERSKSWKSYEKCKNSLEIYFEKLGKKEFESLVSKI